jgi:hypothetical protein
MSPSPYRNDDALQVLATASAQKAENVDREELQHRVLFSLDEDDEEGERSQDVRDLKHNSTGCNSAVNMQLLNHASRCYNGNSAVTSSEYLQSENDSELNDSILSCVSSSQNPMASQSSLYLSNDFGHDTSSRKRKTDLLEAKNEEEDDTNRYNMIYSGNPNDISMINSR